MIAGDPGQPATPPTGGGTGEWIGAIINAGASLYDSHQDRKVSKWNTKQTIAANKAEAELAYQRQMEMWHLQNAYNSPEEQMKRFGAAGLNPHLIYGQGNSGNAATPPAYHPPNIQYQHKAAPYGSAIASILPTLMAVGTWMQNMRMSEVDIQRKKTDTDKTQQMIDYLLAANPKMLQKMDNSLSLFPYQRDYQKFNTEKMIRGVKDMEQEYRHRWGTSLHVGGYDNLMLDKMYAAGLTGGVKQDERYQKGISTDIARQKFLQEIAKTKLDQAKSSYTDMNITDPQALLQLVMGAVLGMTGTQLKLKTTPRGKSIHEVEERMRGGRIKTRRRIYEK